MRSSQSDTTSIHSRLQWTIVLDHTIGYDGFGKDISATKFFVPLQKKKLLKMQLWKKCIAMNIHWVQVDSFQNQVSSLAPCLLLSAERQALGPLVL
jgi:hypothetical protein